MDTSQGPAQLTLGGLTEPFRSIWTRRQKWICILVSLALAVDGLANQTLGLAIPALIRDWHASRAAFAPVAALGLIGVTIGAVLGGIFGDRYGRRTGLICSVALFGLATTATALVGGTGALMGLRFVAGLGLGSTIPNATSMLTEFSPSHRRSLAVGIAFIFVPLGSLVSGLIAAAILPVQGWRVFFAIGGAAPLVLAVALLVALPESPAFLARPRGRAAGTMAPDRFQAAGIPAHGATITRGALFGAAVRLDTVLLWGAFFFCVMALYSMFSWAPSLLAGHGYSLAATSSLMAAFNFGGIGGAVASILLIHRFGSSRTAALMCLPGAGTGVLLAMLPLHPGLGLLPLTLGFVAASFFIGGLQNTLYPLAAHLYPPFAKATGVGAASAAGRIGAVASSYTGVLALQWHGSAGFFGFLAAIMVAAMMCVLGIRNQIPRQA